MNTPTSELAPTQTRWWVNYAYDTLSFLCSDDYYAGILEFDFITNDYGSYTWGITVIPHKESI